MFSVGFVTVFSRHLRHSPVNFLPIRENGWLNLEPEELIPVPIFEPEIPCATTTLLGQTLLSQKNIAEVTKWLKTEISFQIMWKKQYNYRIASDWPKKLSFWYQGVKLYIIPSFQIEKSYFSCVLEYKWYFVQENENIGDPLSYCQ